MKKSKQAPQRIVIGIDLGSVTAKIVFLDQDKNVLEHRYLRHRGHPGQVLADNLSEIFQLYDANLVDAIGITGSGGKRIAPILGATFINEVIAETLAVSRLHGGVRSIINIGGQDSKLIQLENQDNSAGFIIENFTMNTLCAAGTGAFLDQQATRLGVKIEGEFGELAMQSQSPPRIAGRCSVFAKSDMIHLQQKGTSIADIVAGLCFAMARNFKATIGKNTEIKKNVAFIGGTARNLGMVRAFREVLELSEEELIIPEHNSLIGAIGAALNVFEEHLPFHGVQAIREHLKNVVESEDGGFSPLQIREAHLVSKEEIVTFKRDGSKVNAYLGIDIGSISTNIVLIDEQRQIISKQYLRTGPQPIEAVKEGLRILGQDMGNQINILGAATTGSARYLIGDFIGADLVKDEITAHARGAREVDPNVDTIFEIGGQDSKYIRMESGAILDFEMNKVCAAGTGSFLEEQAERLAIDIKSQFSEYALCAKDPSRCGERCTVFMESDLVHHQQKGVPKEDIVAGLAYSIVHNYINKVVEGRPIGNTIFLQGGVAFNKAVIAAFETVLGKAITVPPHHEVMGAYGAALLVADADDLRGSQSRFKGWNASEQEYKLKTFECQSCANNCTINRITIGEDSVFYYGSRCDKYDRKTEVVANDKVPDYYLIRDQLLRNSYPHRVEPGKGKAKIGIPLSMTIYEDLPLWLGFFTELGFEVVLTDPTNKKTITKGLERVTEETCFPIKVLHGHIMELIERKVDYIFLPYMMDMWNDNKALKETLICTYVQTAPDLIKTAIRPEEFGIKMLSPIVKPSVGIDYLVEQLHERMGTELKIDKKAINAALKRGKQALLDFRAGMLAEGEKALAGLADDDFAIAIISRPYNGPDRGINLDIPQKLNSLGVKVIPMDMLPLATEEVQTELPNMFWWFGHRVLSATKLIRDNPKLYPIYINNFACGPDSFALQYFLHLMGNKPNMILEIDEHSADAGLMTRAEAFVDSIRYLQKRQFTYTFQELKPPTPVLEMGKRMIKQKKTLYLPNVNDQVVTLAAALQSNGIHAEVLPETNDESLQIARQHTNNKECFPYIIMTGDIVKAVQKPGFDPKNAVFLMPAGSGVCRLNHYESMQRLVLERLGMSEVEIYSPTAEKAMIDLGRINPKLPMDVWTSVVAGDCLFKAMRQTRPYEVEKGATDKAYAQARQIICDAFLNKSNIINAMKLARQCFDGVKVDKTKKKPRIGIVGEFYLRWHPFSNNHFFDLVEKLGGEIVAPSTAENMLHFSHTTIDSAKRMGKHLEHWTMYLSGEWMKFQEHRIYEPFANFLEIYPEPNVQELEDLAKPYADEIAENEITISMGKARWLLETQKIQGIVNLIPFTCLLGTPIAAMLKSLKEDYPQAAITTFKFDGAADVNIHTRLEAYMHQAEQYLVEEALSAAK